MVFGVDPGSFIASPNSVFQSVLFSLKAFMKVLGFLAILVTVVSREGSFRGTYCYQAILY